MNVITNSFSPDQKNRLFLIQNSIYDGAGDIRWYTTHGGTTFHPLSDHLIAIQVYGDRASTSTPPGPEIKIINLMGELLSSYEVPSRNHHEIIEKIPGGNLLVPTNAEEYFDISDDTEDRIIEIDRESGEIVKEWDLSTIFDPERPRLWVEQKNDWCHLNSIQFDPTDNTLLISSKLQYFISKIDYDSGDIKWILGNHENWKEPWQPYLLTPLNFDTTAHPDQDYTYAQHMPRLRKNGNVIVYDNGGHRPGGAYTRAVEFRVDPENMTVEKIWSYDLDDVATAVGSIHIYEDESVQIGHGGKDWFYEVSRNGQVLFEASMRSFYRSYPFDFYKPVQPTN
jgi:arylsulfate sulfotransferase